MKNGNMNDWTLTECDIENGHLHNNYHMLQANMAVIKTQERDFLAEYEDLQQQFKDILATAGINQSQYPFTPNRNLMTSDPMTPTLMCSPRDLDILKCQLINTLNGSAYHEDRLTSDGNSDDGHSPMSTDTELSDLEDDNVFDREVEGCEIHLQQEEFSTSFITGHVNKNSNAYKKLSGSCKGQGSNPLASSTMIEDVGAVDREHKSAFKGMFKPKASSTIMNRPCLEGKINKPFSPVVKLKNIKKTLDKYPNNDKTETHNSRSNSVFTWSLQQSTTDIPLEECYLRTVKKRYSKSKNTARCMSKVNSRSGLFSSRTVDDLSVISKPAQHTPDVTVDDSLMRENTLYCQRKIISRSSTRTDLRPIRNGCDHQKLLPQVEVFKKPQMSSRNSKITVERKNSVVKKLMKFRESFKRKNGASNLRTLATL